MATLANLVTRVRENIRDTVATYTYADSVVEQRVTDGVNQYNTDFSDNYTVSTLPSSLEWIIVLLATELMCFIRAGDDASSGSTTTTGDSYSITLGDLSISESGLGGASETRAFSNWIDMAKFLRQYYYDKVLGAGEYAGAGTANITVGNFVRMSRTTGKKVPQSIAQPPAGLTIALSSVTKSSCKITWEQTNELDFYKYEVYRDASLIYTAYDGYELTYTDPTLAVSTTYTYQVAHYNNADLYSYSNAAQTMTSAT